jgi:hypothetical protein
MKFIEVAVPDDYDSKKMRIVIEGEGVPTAVGPALPVGRAELETVLASFVDDVQLAFGASGEGEIDEERLDWPNLASTYHGARALLTGRSRG